MICTDIASNGSSYVAVGDDILFSRDGVLWELATYDRDAVGTLRRVTAYPGGYVAISATAAIRSADGLTLVRAGFFPEGMPDATDVTWGTPGLVAVGARGAIWTSDDGSSFAPQNSGTTDDLASVVWDGQRYYAFGGNRVASFVSTDGVQWRPLDPSVQSRPSARVRWTGAEMVISG